MKPAVKLSLGGRELVDRLQRLVCLDKAGFAGDALTLTVHAENLAIPRRGVEIECELGYEETGTWSVGFFVVEDVSLKGSPDVMTLQCISQPQGQSSVAALQTTREERSWDSYAVAGTTFADVVGAVVSGVGLTAKIDNRLAGLQMPSVQQTNESDAAFLHRLTVERNGIVKMNAGVVVFETRDAGRVGSLDIVYDREVMGYSFSFAERYNITSVRAKYQDIEAAQIRTITLGSGKGRKVMPKVFPDRATAELAASALLKHYQREYISAEVTMPMPSPIGGGGALLSELYVNLSGFPGGSATNAQYVCVEARHTFTRTRTGGGLVSVLALKRPQS